MGEWWQDKRDTIEVWWLMRDPMERQAIMAVGLSLVLGLLQLAFAGAERSIRGVPRN